MRAVLGVSENVNGTVSNFFWFIHSTRTPSKVEATPSNFVSLFLSVFLPLLKFYNAHRTGNSSMNDVEKTPRILAILYLSRRTRTNIVFHGSLSGELYTPFLRPWFSCFACRFCCSIGADSKNKKQTHNVSQPFSLLWHLHGYR